MRRVQELPGPKAAADLARRLLAPVDGRDEHTAAVARRAVELAPAVPAEDQRLLVIAAWWHDLGSAPELVRTGFPPVDGALYLASEGHSPRLCGLVAHHCAAMYEAEERGLAETVAGWPREQGPVPDALWMAGTATGSRVEPAVDGGPMTGLTRSRARSDIDAAIERTKERLTVRRPGRPPGGGRR